ncbi:hypothetical protein DEO72_LG10g2558 [Vigna unguiculata]|uniref:Uncharacterized protein n=1 Tax=Vigna unguiculata TaxID=3917 RepID=A0A4D6NGL9_VIGUN|nr:hypothetical protein DEO72_LG10g2558 [Vigna unguiculata]
MNTGTLELWLGLASVASVSVLVVASTDGSRFLSKLADEFGSLGTLRTMFVLGIPPSVRVCDP